jgi:hypothetical protein
MSDYLLTFELDSDDNGQSLIVHGSSVGLEALANSLLRLIKNTKDGLFNHDHLMIEKWGGHELTSTPLADNTELPNHVKIYCWKGDKFQL